MAIRNEPRWWKWVVLVAVYVEIVILCATVFMAGVLYIAILNKYNANEAVSSLAVALNSGLLSLLGPVSCIVVDRFSCRVSIVAGAILLILSGLSSAFVNNLNWLCVTFGLIGGVGNALVGVPNSLVLGYYFDKRRNLVIAMSTAVVGIGMFISSPIGLYLLEHLSLDEAFLVIAALNSHLCIVGVICKPSLRERDIQNKNKIANDNELNITENSTGSKIKRNVISLCLRKILRETTFSILTNYPFFVFVISTFTWNFALSICLVHFPNYASILGASDIQIALLMTCLSVSNACGRFVAALLVAKSSLDLLALHILFLGILGIAATTYPLYSDIELAKYVFAVIAGVFTGAPNALMTPISISIVGVENLSAAHGQEYMFCGMGFLAGPPIAGLLYEYTGSYRSSFIFAGCMNIFGAILAIAVRLSMKQKDATGNTTSTKDNVAKASERDTTAKLLVNETKIRHW